MKFKSPEVENEYNTAIPTQLQVICNWFDQLSIAHFQIESVCTRVLEAICGDSGVHEAHRGVDLRDQTDAGYLYTPEQVQFLVSEMNRRFPRKDKFLTMIHHSFEGGMFHFHVQYPPEAGIVSDLGPDEPTPPVAA